MTTDPYLVVACPSKESLAQAKDGRLLEQTDDHLKARHLAYLIHRGLLDREGRAPRIEIWQGDVRLGHTGAKNNADRDTGWGREKKGKRNKITFGNAR